VDENKLIPQNPMAEGRGRGGDREARDAVTRKNGNGDGGALERREGGREGEGAAGLRRRR
jgi:hypothetical protein